MCFAEEFRDASLGETMVAPLVSVTSLTNYSSPVLCSLRASFNLPENPSKDPSKDQPYALTSGTRASRYFSKKIISFANGEEEEGGDSCLSTDGATIAVQ